MCFIMSTFPNVAAVLFSMNYVFRSFTDFLVGLFLSLFFCLWICKESQFPHDIPFLAHVKNCQCCISFDFDYDSFVIKNFNVLCT